MEPLASSSSSLLLHRAFGRLGANLAQVTGARGASERLGAVWRSWSNQPRVGKSRQGWGGLGKQRPARAATPRLLWPFLPAELHLVHDECRKAGERNR